MSVCVKIYFVRLHSAQITAAEINGCSVFQVQLVHPAKFRSGQCSVHKTKHEMSGLSGRRLRYTISFGGVTKDPSRRLNKTNS